MSTELIDVKDIVEEIHEIAKVPREITPANEHIYGMTLAIIGSLIAEMDRFGIPMAEQRMIMGNKKDELIGELIRLRTEGVLKGPTEH